MKYLKPLTLFQELKNSKSSKNVQRVLLGLDVGEKYVGLALSDPLLKVASPLSVLERKKSNIDDMAEDFQKMVSFLSLAGLVVGCTFDRKLSSLQAVEVKLFIEKLHETGKLEDVKYTYWNECLTSKLVAPLLEPLELHPVQQKSITDKFAAVGILQGYLDYMNRKMETGTAK